MSSIPIDPVRIPYGSYDASMFTLSYPAPPTDEQWQHFLYSLAPQIQVYWDQATPDYIKKIRSVIRTRKLPSGATIQERVRIVLRMDNDVLSRDMHTMQAEHTVRQRAAGPGGIVAILIGNEMEPKDLRWHGPKGEKLDWGNTVPPITWETKYPHSPMQIQMQKVKDAAAYLGLGGYTQTALVAGALMVHGYTEDDAPDPGLFAIREDWELPLSGYVDGYGMHYYEGGWWERDPQLPNALDTSFSTLTGHVSAYSDNVLDSYIQALVGARVATATNVNRFKHAVRYWSGYYHKLVYLDESNVKNATYTPERHMEACVGKSKLLIHSVNPEGYKLGERIRMYSPFTQNGDANDWPAEYLMDTAGSYEIVRVHMIEEGYQP